MPTRGLAFLRKHVFFLSFFAPVAILEGVYIVFRIYPFGNRQILVYDFWQQYYPFFSDLWHKVREGSSLLWSWTSGGGDYLPLISYYMASPLNLLALLFPHAALREAMTIVLLLKIGFAGLFFAVYLNRTYKRSDLSLPAAASLYALCAFTLGFYWCVMWFDTFALFPLVMLGVQSLVREGKFRLFLVSLCLSVFTNYYIGFLTCIFVVIMFFAQCIIHKTSPREFPRRLGLITLCSIVAVGITAASIFPAYMSLQNSYGAKSAFPETWLLHNSFFDVLGNLIAFTPATVTVGLPNLYCGMLTIMLAAVFIVSPKIALREKLVFLCIAVFLVLSCNINVLDYIWHGFHFTNMVPFRFSFMLSFVLLVMAYKAYTLMDEVRTRELLAMGAAAAFVLVMAFLGRQKLMYVLGSLAVAAAYLAIFTFFPKKSAAPGQGAVSARRAVLLNMALLIVILVELSTTAHEGVRAVRTTIRNVYPDKYDEVRRLLDARQTPETGFYRTEFTGWYTINDPSLYSYDGISLFASTANVNLIRFIEGLGLPAWQAGNRYYYAETSPLSNAFLNMRYLVSRSGDSADREVFWKPSGEPAEKSLLLENTRYLPLGFMVDTRAAEYVHNDINPFLSQNDLFRRAAGLDGSLFTVIDSARADHENYRVTRPTLDQYNYVLNAGKSSGRLKWNYRLPEDAFYFAYCLIDNSEKAQLASGDAAAGAAAAGQSAASSPRTLEIKRPYITALGRFSKDDIISISSDMSAQGGTVKLYVAYLDQKLFDRGYEKLADEVLTLTEFTGTRVSGTVTALRDGLLYTSIPSENRWKAFVDGVETEIKFVDGAMAALSLTQGVHDIEFRYHNESLSAGILMSVISLAACAGIIIVDRYRRGKLKSAAALK